MHPLDDDLSAWKVLVVDDEPDSIEVVTLVLEASGALVTRASTGEEALACYRQERPTLVLTDLSMPEMDGWALLKAIRELDDGHKPPIIALTAHAMLGDKDRVMKEGFNGYLSKPLKMYTLLDDLKTILKTK